MAQASPNCCTTYKLLSAGRPRPSAAVKIDRGLPTGQRGRRPRIARTTLVSGASVARPCRSPARGHSFRLPAAWKEIPPPRDCRTCPLDPSLFRYIWRHSRAEQLFLLAVILASLPFYWVSLEVPKQIVNDAIQGRAFQDGKTVAKLFEWTVEPAGLPRRRPCHDLPGPGARADALSARPEPLVPPPRPRQRRLQVLHQRAQGHSRRAHAAADALRPVRAARCASGRRTSPPSSRPRPPA